MPNQNSKSNNLEDRFLKLEKRVKKIKCFPNTFYITLGFLMCLGIISTPGVYQLYKYSLKANEAKNKAIANAEACEAIYEKIQTLNIVSMLEQYQDAEKGFQKLKNEAEVLIKKIREMDTQAQIASDKYEQVLQRLNKGVVLDFPINSKAEKRKYLSGKIIINLEGGEPAKLINGHSAKKFEFDILYDESTKSIAPVVSPTDSFKLKLIDH